jgi:tetratricopeptide (TPR) repeat protein
MGKSKALSAQPDRSLPTLAPTVAPALPVWLRASGLVVLVLAAYTPVWHAGYIWDDDAHITNNATLRNLTGLRNIWLRPDATPQYYPLVHTTFWCEYHLWGLRPLGYHLTNVLLHAANALLLWRVLRRLGLPAAWWIAGLFALHPVHVESVAWVTERKNVLSALCYLSSMLAWLRCWPAEESRPRPAGRWLFYGASLLLFLCGLLSKTVTCSLPAVFLLLRWWKQGRVSRGYALATVPFFVIGLPLALHTASLERYHVGAIGEEWNWSYAERALIAGRALWFYAGKLLCPQPLMFMYPRWQICATSWWQYLFPAAVLILLIALYAWRRRLGRGPLAAALFFSGTLVPALGFFNVYPMRYSFVADHFQYLASVGVLVLAGAASQYFLARWPVPRRGVVCGVALTILGALTWLQARVYHDALTLWNDTLAKNPSCWMAYSNRATAHLQLGHAEQALSDFAHAVHGNADLADGHVWAGAYADRGEAYRDLGQKQQAIDDYNHALALEPDVAEVYFHRALVYQQLGETAQAIPDYSRAIELKPDKPDFYINRGTAYRKSGQMSLAVADFTRAIELKSERFEYTGMSLATIYAYRGAAYQALGQAPQAFADLNRAIELQPDLADAYNNRGLTYQLIGQFQQAVADHDQALELLPDYADAYVNRGNAYLNLNQVTQGLADFTRAIEVKPDCAVAYYDRGNLYLQLGRIQEAIADCTRAIELQPNLAQAYCARGTAYHKQGQLEPAILDYTHALELQPDYVAAYKNRAIAYRQDGQPEQAFHDYQHARILQEYPHQVSFDPYQSHQ